MTRQDFLRSIFLLVNIMLLSGCADVVLQGKHPARAPESVYQISFTLPPQPRWHSAGVEQDANGYLHFWLPVVKGRPAAQSLYLNFGRSITTPLPVARQQVTDALRAGCRRVHSQLLAHKKNAMVFMLRADGCVSGRPLWQVFHVFNKVDGQYAIVYSANPTLVSLKSRLRMQQVVRRADVIASRSR